MRVDLVCSIQKKCLRPRCVSKGKDIRIDVSSAEDCGVLESEIGPREGKEMQDKPKAAQKGFLRCFLNNVRRLWFIMIFIFGTFMIFWNNGHGLASNFSSGDNFFTFDKQQNWMIEAAEQDGEILRNILDSLDITAIQTDTEYLSHDLLEGRAPGTHGEDLAVLYIASQMKIAGLHPLKSYKNVYDDNLHDNHFQRRRKYQHQQSIVLMNEKTSSYILSDYVHEVPMVGISPLLPSEITKFNSNSREGPNLLVQNNNTLSSSLKSVPLIFWVKSDDISSISFSNHLYFHLWDDFVATSEIVDRDNFSLDLSCEILFIGFGINSKEWEWSDYKDVDVRGKMLLAFFNEPPASDDEPNLFNGENLTYYGRWTYKVEEARRRGALGIILIHTTLTAGYPFSVLSSVKEAVVTSSFNTNGDKESHNAKLKAIVIVTESVGHKLAEACGESMERWVGEAASRNFRPRLLGLQMALHLAFRRREFVGKNVVGFLPGQVQPEKYVLITAHHDHLGVGGADNTNDSIFNGAVDNAVGVGLLLQMGRSFAAHTKTNKLQRSIMFVSLTGEEAGLVGAKAFVENPPLPLRPLKGSSIGDQPAGPPRTSLPNQADLEVDAEAQAVANINFDVLNIDGRTEDIVGLGVEENRRLASLFLTAAKREGLRVSGDPNPSQGSFFRSDTHIFFKAGVPAIYLWTGRHFVGQPSDYAQERRMSYINHRYHRPSDEFDPTWPLAGLLQQARVASRLCYMLSMVDIDVDVHPNQQPRVLGRGPNPP
jgi:hypothetical protein